MFGFIMVKYRNFMGFKDIILFVYNPVGCLTSFSRFWPIKNKIEIEGTKT